MNDFYQGVFAAIGMLGGMCAFNYWMFGLMEKRLELKIDTLATDVHRIALELKEERLMRDKMYQFVLTSIKQ